jgi:hypothetical protein
MDKDKNIRNHKSSPKKLSQRPLVKSDFEAVLQAATKPLKKERAEKESGETSESHRSDDSSEKHKC